MALRRRPGRDPVAAPLSAAWNGVSRRPRTRLQCGSQRTEPPSSNERPLLSTPLSLRMHRSQPSPTRQQSVPFQYAPLQLRFSSITPSSSPAARRLCCSWLRHSLSDALFLGFFHVGHTAHSAWRAPPAIVFLPTLNVCFFKPMTLRRVTPHPCIGAHVTSPHPGTALEMGWRGCRYPAGGVAAVVAAADQGLELVAADSISAPMRFFDLQLALRC